MLSKWRVPLILATVVLIIVGLLVFREKPAIIRMIMIWGSVLLLTAYVLVLLWWQDKYLKYILVLPSVLLLLAVTVFPFVYALIVSFYDVSAATINDVWKYIGLDNYKFLVLDRLTYQSVILTIELVLLAVFLEFAIGLTLALLFDRVHSIFLSLFLVPMMTTPLIAGLIWKSMFNLDTGFINILLGQLKLPGVHWLTFETLPVFNRWEAPSQVLNLTYAMVANLVVDAWQWTPMMTLLLYSGLRSLPVEPFESAVVDGANPLQVFRHITLPLLRPVALVAVLIRLIDAVKTYDPIWALFGTGFRTLNIYLGTFFFRSRDYGGGSALSILILMLVSALLPVAFKVFYTEE
jgi:multiple sugar transport system permease protein